MAEVAINNELLQEYLNNSSAELRDLGVNIKLLKQYLTNPDRPGNHGDRLRAEAHKAMEMIELLQEDATDASDTEEVDTPPEQEEDQTTLEEETILVYADSLRASAYQEVIRKLLHDMEVTKVFEITGDVATIRAIKKLME